jgi:hypothetical protein
MAGLDPAIHQKSKWLLSSDGLPGQAGNVGQNQAK